MEGEQDRNLPKKQSSKQTDLGPQIRYIRNVHIKTTVCKGTELSQWRECESGNAP